MVPASIDITDSALIMTMSMAMLLLLGGAVVMFIRSGGRASIILGVIMAMWGVPYVIKVVYSVMGMLVVPRVEYLNPGFIYSGIFLSTVPLLYAFELVKPGWCRLRNVLLFLAPAIALASLLGVAALADGGFNHLYSSADVARDIGRFNVWMRLLTLVGVLVYNICALSYILSVERRYVRWCRNNSSREPLRSGIRLVYIYSIGLLLIDIIYAYTVYRPVPAAMLVHTVCVLVLFCFVLYQASFNTSAFPHEFHIHDDSPVEVSYDDASFAGRIPEYAAAVVEWLDREKPYLNANFKLMDVAAILPLNRTYLSRVFNEGIGTGFTEYIRRRRLDEAKRMLSDEPDRAIADIAEHCGFSSHSSFHRSFAAANGGVTPGEYRAHEQRRRGMPEASEEPAVSGSIDAKIHESSS